MGRPILIIIQLSAYLALSWLCSCNPSARKASVAEPTANQSTAAADDKASSGKQGLETAYLAGGCFWGMEEILRDIDGVVDTEVGYMGGSVAEPRYSDVSKGDSGHAETVRVVFDPKRLSYRDLLEKWFFRMHDPTTKDRQGHDMGTQYRSAIFVTNAVQRKAAQDAKKRTDASGRWNAPIVTQIVDAGAFTPAEDYHQDYLEKNPRGYTCHYLRDWEDI